MSIRMLRRLSGYASVLVIALLLVLTACSGADTDSAAPAANVEKPAAQFKQAALRTEEIFDQAAYKDLLTIRYFDLESKEDSGDSILIRTPDGKTMLIDAGIPDVGPQVVQYLDKLGVQAIDFAVNTHPHADHIGGFMAVLQSKEIKTMLMENLLYDSNAYRNTIQALQDKKVKVEYPEDGATFQVARDLKVEILNPPQGVLPSAVKKFTYPEVNNQAMVLKLTYKENTFLFSADIYKEREYKLVDGKGAALDADMMHVPHHGNTTSSSPAYVKAVSPQIAVISSNILQSADVVKRYEKNNAKVYITGLHGNVLITSDGKKLKVITEKDWSSQ